MNFIVVDAALLALCPDSPQWPQRWQIDSGELAVGERIVETFKPFLSHLIRKDLAPRTLKRHRDHLRLLGGELIRRRHEDPDLKTQGVSELIAKLIDDETGPLVWPRISEFEQDAFHVTCIVFSRLRPRPLTNPESYPQIPLRIL